MDKEIQRLLELLNSTENMLSGVSKQQQEKLLQEIDDIISELEKKGGEITRNASNLRKANLIKKRLNRVILDDDYMKELEDFAERFDKVSSVQEGYFKSMLGDFTTSKTIDVIREETVKETITLLTESGLEANVTNKIVAELSNGIKEGTSSKELRKRLTSLITEDGILEKYTSQITTDSINGFSRVYNQVVTDDLDLEWYQYVGSIVGDSRPFCREMVRKQYVNKNEFATILNGNINGVRVPIYSKTGLPSGMIAGTNPENFVSRAGGYRCNHLLMPVLESAVPESYKTT